MRIRVSFTKTIKNNGRACMKRTKQKYGKQ